MKIKLRSDLAPKHVERVKGFVPKSAWIAHVLEDHGLTRGAAHNRMKPEERKYPCPGVRRRAIEDALRHFRMI